MKPIIGGNPQSIKVCLILKYKKFFKILGALSPLFSFVMRPQIGSHGGQPGVRTSEITQMEKLSAHILYNNYTYTSRYT